jgi:hypothetical protein
MNRVLCLGLLLSLFLTACKDQPVQQVESQDEQQSEEFVSEMPTVKESAEVKEIIYSMYLPTDMADLFDRAGTNFNPEIPAPVNFLPLYTNPEQIAVMLGVLGVDLSYMKILQQKALAAEYYTSIKVLSGNLEIPDQIFEKSTKKLEKNLGNQDSLAAIIETVYEDTDAFFRENGNDNLASLSLLGGWVEAMYIGISIYEAEEGNRTMADKLLQQKFTLNSIYSILSNHQESLQVTSYMLMLKRLRKEFQKVQIRYPVEGFSVDTTQKRIQASKAQIHYEPSTLTDINRIISQIRAELISVE